VGLIVGAIRYSKLNLSSRIFFLLLLITPFKELVSYYFKLTERNGTVIDNSFMFLEYALFCLGFYLDIKLKWIIPSLLLLLGFGMINGIFIEPFLEAENFNITLVESLFMIIVYFLFLVVYFKKVDSFSLTHFPLFWIGLGFMLFSIVSIISFGFLNLETLDHQWETICKYARIYSNFLLYLLFIPAFLSSQKQLCDFTTST
jgi:hypothetical protein